MITKLILDVCNNLSIFKFGGYLFGRIKSLDFWNMKFHTRKFEFLLNI